MMAALLCMAQSCHLSYVLRRLVVVFKLCSGCLCDNFGGVRSSEMAAMRELARQGCLYKYLILVSQ